MFQYIVINISEFVISFRCEISKYLMSNKRFTILTIFYHSLYQFLFLFLKFSLRAFLIEVKFYYGFILATRRVQVLRIIFQPNVSFCFDRNIGNIPRRHYLNWHESRTKRYRIFDNINNRQWFGEKVQLCCKQRTKIKHLIFIKTSIVTPKNLNVLKRSRMFSNV